MPPGVLGEGLMARGSGESVMGENHTGLSPGDPPFPTDGEEYMAKGV